MAAFHPNQPNGQHKCDNCGALYNVTWRHLPARDSDQEQCHRCQQTMAKWNSTDYPKFELVEEGAADKNVRFID